MNQPVASTPAPRQAPDAVVPDYAAIKQRQQATWASGDFAVIGVTLQIVGESLAEAVDIHAGERVIDIAAGNGNATLAAAHRFARVTSTDYVPALLEKGRMRAEAEGLNIEFREADAEALPFQDGSFDVALSTFGVMFTPDHARCAAEMMRVVRSGGRVLRPVHKAFGALDEAGRQALEQDLIDMLDRYNTAGDASLVVPAEYLEAVIFKRPPDVLH